MSTWASASKTIGRVQPATLSIAKEVYDAAKKKGFDISVMWGYANDGDEHGTGRAIDFMVYNNRAEGDFVRNYLWIHRKRLRLQHVIWWQRITSTTNTPGVARPMANRGNSTANHMDHPHMLVNAGPYRKLTVVGKAVAAVKRKPKPVGRKSYAEIANEVKAGKWGNGADRIRRLKKAGYNPTDVQRLVNGGSSKKSNTTIAREVIAGKWGNGSDRIARLKKAGYNPTSIQNEVNRLV